MDSLTSPVSFVDLLEHPELRRCHSIPLVRSNRKFKCAHSLSHPNRKVFIEDNLTAAEEFNVSLDRVNWLGNIMSFTFIPAAALTPWLVSRYGVRRTVRHIASISLFRMIRDALPPQCELGSVCLILAAWIRYAGTASSLTANRAYALLIIGQVRPTISLRPSGHMK